MFYYPKLLKQKNLVNLQVIFPGGWGQLKANQPGLHFLWENLFFAPTKSIPDPDEWLWSNTLDFWSVTSFESIRLNFTLHQNQVSPFSKTLKELIEPRTASTVFIEKEISDLKHYWQTDRDQKEDTLLRQLFKSETVVPPNPKLVQELELSNFPSILELWRHATPFVIILGEVQTDDLISLSQVFPQKNEFKAPKKYGPPKAAQHFFSPTRWGIKIELQQSHLFELLVIELWEQIFKVQFYFEYHLDDLFIWTNDLEHPRLLAQKVSTYTLTESDFNNALNAYLKFLEKIYRGENSKSLEKLAELTEGLHAHPFQAATFGVNEAGLDLSLSMKHLSFNEFKSFYEKFIQTLPALK